MKRNKIEKKLVLSKKTITNLNDLDMQKIEGGFSAILCSGDDYTCHTVCCPFEP